MSQARKRVRLNAARAPRGYRLTSLTGAVVRGATSADYPRVGELRVPAHELVAAFDGPGGWELTIRVGAAENGSPTVAGLHYERPVDRWRRLALAHDGDTESEAIAAREAQLRAQGSHLALTQHQLSQLPLQALATFALARCTLVDEPPTLVPWDEPDAVDRAAALGVPIGTDPDPVLVDEAGQSWWRVSDSSDLDKASRALDRAPRQRAQLRRRAVDVQEVADVWHAARDRGEAPTAAVQDHFDVSRAQAQRYVDKARATPGLLPPAHSGRHYRKGTGR